jgi:hypothetical protein
MRNRQDEILGEGVEEPEGHLVVAPAPIDRIARHVFERVMHPTHVPLEAETQAPRLVGDETPEKAVDSSAIVIAPGNRP